MTFKGKWVVTRSVKLGDLKADDNDFINNDVYTATFKSIQEGLTRSFTRQRHLWDFITVYDKGI